MSLFVSNQQRCQRSWLYFFYSWLYSFNIKAKKVKLPPISFLGYKLAHLLPQILRGLTHGRVRWVTHIVLGPLGAVFNEIQVPAGGVQGMIAHVNSSLYIPHITLPDLDNGVIGQLGKTQKKKLLNWCQIW